jgi:MFS family permease
VHDLRMTAASSAIANPLVRAFAAGRFASVVGAQMISLAVGWQLYERTGSAISLGLVGAFELAPVFLLMIPAGNAADRMPRRDLARYAHALLALAALGLAYVSWSGAPTAWIYALLVLVGTARAFASPSVSTILPQLLPPAQFASSNAWLSSTYEVASTCGPALAGWMIWLTGSATATFAAAAALQVVFIAVLSTFPARPPEPTDHARSPREVFAGFAFIRRNPVFLAAITLDLFAVLLAGAIALLPVFAKDILHVGDLGLGFLRAAPALGALTMALILTRARPWNRPGRALLLAVVGFGAATIGFGLSRDFGLSLACLFLVGLFDEISVVVRMTLEQMITPDRLRGRVSSINYVFIGFSNELGMLESGIVASLIGAAPCVVVGGVGSMIVAGVVALRWPQLARIGPLADLRPDEDRPFELPVLPAKESDLPA